MRKYELQPNEENVRSTFLNDSIGRNKNLLNFIRMLNSLDENYSIALDSYWGSGKTFFVRQVKMILDATNETAFEKAENDEEILEKWNSLSKNMALKSYVSIYYDAWKNDHDDDPIFSLIYQMIIDTKSDESINSRIGTAEILSVAGKITKAIAGFDPNDIASSLKKEDYLSTLKERKTVDENIKKFINTILPEGCDHLLIIIDELDRCNPKFAVNLLERIKHYFSSDKIIFLFSVNLSELQITIRNYYGDEFNASRYLDRFFDRRITLPPPDLDSFLFMIGFNNSKFVAHDMIKTVIQKNNMQMRECIKYISTMELLEQELSQFDLCPNNTPNSNANILLINIIIPIVIGEMICNIFLYNTFLMENDYSLLRYFFNDIDIIKNNHGDLSLLFDSNDFDINNIKLLHSNLQLFYKALMGDDGEVRIGNCLVTEKHRKMFWKAISLLSDDFSYSE